MWDPGTLPDSLYHPDLARYRRIPTTVDMNSQKNCREKQFVSPAIVLQTECLLTLHVWFMLYPLL